MAEDIGYYVILSCASKTGIIEVEASEDGDARLLTSHEVARERLAVPSRPGEDASASLARALRRKDGERVAAPRQVVNDLFGWDL